jgi:hypothetical protein
MFPVFSMAVCRLSVGTAMVDRSFFWFFYCTMTPKKAITKQTPNE